jgi:opacity protein-like surface antigen
MSQVLRRMATALPAGLLAISPLYSQGAEFSLGGGLGIPLGTYDDVVKMGWQGTAAISFVPQGVPFGVQLDGSYAQFSDETPFDIKNQLIYGTANAVYQFESSEETKLRPYLIAGIGVYNFKAIGDDAFEDSATEFGLNAGAGVDVSAGGAGLFIEGRYQNVFTEGPNIKFMPITIGIRFGGS